MHRVCRNSVEAQKKLKEQSSFISGFSLVAPSLSGPASVTNSQEEAAASRHWNYWKGRLGVPYFANDTKTTVLATFGHTTYLHCVVGNLGDRQVQV